MLRTIAATGISLIIALVGFRFSKHYRWESTRYHSVIYALVDTVHANHLAEKIRPMQDDWWESLESFD